MNDRQLIWKKISDLEAFWRTRDRLMQWYYESSNFSATQRTLEEGSIEPADTEEVA
jgi:hypothetical protein